MMPKRRFAERWKCRLCGGTMQKVFALAPTPIANDYAPEPDIGAFRYPLELSQCSRCGHVQQRFVIEGLFNDYKYTTPQTVARYLQPFVERLHDKYPTARRVLEIGSNNGTYLTLLRDAGFEAIGVDPAATGEGNIEAYFTAQWANGHKKQYDLILANNVFAHIDNLEDVFRGIQILLAPGGAVIFEVQYLHALIEHVGFDMIYHEHMSYHAISPLATLFLRRRGFVMTKYEFIPTHGGSIRITAERNTVSGVPIPEEPKINWASFTERVDAVKASLRERLEGRKVVLLGAAAKVTTLIHHCGIADRILYACDDTKQKIGKYIPGTDIEIKPTSELGQNPALLGAWNFEREWREKFPKNEFINPLEVECVSA